MKERRLIGSGHVDIYDETRVAAISMEIAAAIDAAVFGEASWDEVPMALSRGFPGSWGGLYSINFPESRLNFASLQNIDPGFVGPWLEHFAYINPWAAYWIGAKSGTIALSEEVSPARLHSHTEFYNDWLRPQAVDAAAGLKIEGDRGEMVNLLTHFPLTHSDTYGRAILQVMSRVRGTLDRSVKLARLLRHESKNCVAAAAIVERSRCAAFVVESNRLVREANQNAVDLFSRGSPAFVHHKRFTLTDNVADNRFGVLLAAMSRGVPTERSSFTFRIGADAWEIMMAPLPEPHPVRGVVSLLPPARMVLVLLTELAAHTPAGDLKALSTAFALTPVEIALCKCLLAGDSIDDAADRVGITRESARTRVKRIFQKTGTNRQSQLLLLLSKMT